MFYLYACYHILSAFLSFYVILGYDIKIYHFMDNYAQLNNVMLIQFIYETIIIFS